jgi:hypothetical protein
MAKFKQAAHELNEVRKEKEKLKKEMNDLKELLNSRN